MALRKDDTQIREAFQIFGSILGPLLFLIHVNDMPMAVKCSLLFYADDTCLVFQSKNVKDIKKQLMKFLQTYAIGLLTTS